MGLAIADAEDVYGFQLENRRDLLGYPVCGSSESAASRDAAAIIPTSGGSYALAQLWRHDMSAFHTLEGDEQDAIVGKTKRGAYVHEQACPNSRDRVDLQSNPGKLVFAYNQGLPADSHVARMIGVDPESRRLRIVSHCMPCGHLAPGPLVKNNIHETGMFFLAYCKDPTVFHYMLSRMIGAPIHGDVRMKRPCDSIMRYNQCIRGQLYYIPSKEQLAAVSRL